MMDAACYKERYPDAKVLCPERDVDFFSKELKCSVDGSSEDTLRGICEVHSPSGFKDRFTETVLKLPLKVSCAFSNRFSLCKVAPISSILFLFSTLALSYLSLLHVPTGAYTLF